MRQEHAHGDIEINYLISGRMCYLLGGEWRTYGAGDLVAFWAAQPHHLCVVEPDTRGIWLTVPLGWFLGEEAARPLVAALLIRPLADRSPDDERLLTSWADAWERPTPLAERIVRLEVEARILRLSPGALSTPVSVTGHYGTSDPVSNATDAVVAAMAEVMATSYADHLTVEDIAAPTGLHPRYAMVRFRNSLGVTVWEYLMHLRVAAAQRLLLTTDKGLLAIALACGFGSAARFYPTFKRFTGVTPRAYRQGHGRIPTTK